MRLLKRDSSSVYSYIDWLPIAVAEGVLNQIAYTFVRDNDLFYHCFCESTSL